MNTISLYNKEKLVNRLNLIRYKKNVYRPKTMISFRHGRNFIVVFKNQFLYIDNERIFVLNTIFDSPETHNFVCWLKDINDIYNNSVLIGDKQ